MKTIKRKNNYKYKTIFTIVSIIVVLGVVGLSLRHFFQTSPPAGTTNSDSINLDKPTTDEINAGQETKKNTVDNTNKANIDNNTSGGSQTIIVNLNAIQNNNQVIFDTLIQTTLSTGQCTLTITSGSQTIIKTADIFANPSSSSCKGFAISTSELPKGTWTASLNVVIGSNTGTDSINISVK